MEESKKADVEEESLEGGLSDYRNSDDDYQEYGSQDYNHAQESFATFRSQEPTSEEEGEDFKHYYPSGEFEENYEEGEQYDLIEELEEEEKPCTPEDERNILDKETSEECTTVSETLSNVYNKLSPFSLRWSFGVRRTVELINLTTNDQFEVFYVSSHFGVIYNYADKVMTFLPGHNYPINCISADASGRWLVTADTGEDTVIIVWDHDKRIPVWSLYNVFPNEGTRWVKISQDARFLAAMNCNMNYVLKFWVWTLGRNEPDGVVNFEPSFGKAKHIDFNHLKTEQFVATLDCGVVFCEWTKHKILETFTPDFEYTRKKYGVFRESLFLDDNHTCLTSTSFGQLVVWCDIHFSQPINERVPGVIQKKYLKTVKIHKSGITSLRLSDNVVVSGAEDGTVLFHDEFLRLLYWLPKVKMEPLVSISFNRTYVSLDRDPFSPNFHDSNKRRISNEKVEHVFEYEGTSEAPAKSMKEKEDEEGSLFNKVWSDTSGRKWSKRVVAENPSDCTVKRLPFAMKDFIYLTTTGRIGYVSHKRRKVKHYLYDAAAPLLSSDCNPHKDHVVVGNTQGRLVLYDYIRKKLLLFVNFPQAITALKYSRLGHYLVAGFQNGNVLELDCILLTVKSKIDTSPKMAIKKIACSSNDDFIAFYDQSSLVHLCQRKPSSHTWIFLGKYYSHYKPITDIMFIAHPEPKKHPRLLTIGEDRMLVEYDLNNLEESKLKLLSMVRIEQTAIPCSFTWLQKIYKNPVLLISNDEFKLKVLDPKTNIYQKTTVGATADTPIEFMAIIEEQETSMKPRMIYATQRHIGIRLLPPTGNPFEGMGIIAHPMKLVTVTVSHDFNYVFTAGVNGSSLLMWVVNPTSVDISSQLGGVGLEPFMSLVEGGSQSFLFRELEDFFYYAQIIHQGEDPNLERKVSKYLALCEIPDVFRALGYYPSNYDINNILYELNHLNYEQTGELTTEVSFEEFVKAFLNHRPIRGVSMNILNKALLNISDSSDLSDIILERQELYKALEKKAEGMSHEEAIGYLCILLLPKDEMNPIPPTISIQKFAEQVLGIDFSITEDNVKDITHAFESKDDS